MDLDKTKLASDQYKNLLSRVDLLFEEIRGRHPAHFQCSEGCHSCCKPDLSVNQLEADEIRSYLKKNPEKSKELLILEKKNPFKGTRCSLLNEKGLCGIYEHRPLVCRSHGAPLQFRDPDCGKNEDTLRFRDVCTLNFSQKPLESLPPSDLINLDTLNTLLSLIHRMAHGKDDSRTALKVSQLLKES